MISNELYLVKLINYMIGFTFYER